MVTDHVPLQVVNADFVLPGGGSHPPPRHRLLVHDELVWVHRLQEPAEVLALQPILYCMPRCQVSDVRTLQVGPVLD